MQGEPTHWDEHIRTWRQALRSAGRSAGTIRTRTEHVQALARALRTVALSDVREQHLLEVVGERDWSKAYRRSYYTSIRQFFGWAFGAGLVEVDPTLTLPRISPSKVYGRPTSEDALWNACARARPRKFMMLRLGYELGLRRTEIAMVHRDDVQRAIGGWTLLVHGKGGKERVLEIEDEFARAILDACDPDSGWLFAGRVGWLFPGRVDGHLSGQRVGNLISRLLPAGQSTHGLRHRFAATTHEAVGDVRIVQELLGHESLSTTQMYLPVSTSRKRRALTVAAPLLAPQPPGAVRNPDGIPRPPRELRPAAGD